MLRTRATATAGSRAAPTVNARRDALPAVLTLSADTPAQLLERLVRGERDALPGTGPARLAIVEPDEKKLGLACRAIAAGTPWRGRQQIYFTTQGLACTGGRMALIFPGLDSVFAPRADDLARYFNIPLAPDCTTLDVGRQLSRVIDAVLAFNAFLARILADLGVQADAVAGHSLGEINALSAAGVLPAAYCRADAFFNLEVAAAQVDCAAFLVAGTSAEVVGTLLHGLEGVYSTHDNCPHQAILCGQPGVLDMLRDRLREQGVMCSDLPFAGGFHSPYFEAALVAPHELPLTDPRIPLWSATSAAPLPMDTAERRELLYSFLARPVRFRTLIERLYGAGHRIFLQVGTGSLVGFVGDTLSGHAHAAMAVNQPSRSGLAQLVNTCALLWAEGVDFDTRLLAGPGTAASVSPPPASRALPEDPVQAAVLRTLAAIDAACVEVRQLLRSPPPGGPHRAEPAPAARDTANDSVPPGIEHRIARWLDLQTTIPWVADHALHPQRPGWPVPADGHPVVPMTMEIQMVRRAAEAAFPQFKVIEMRQVQAYRWLGVAQPLEVTIVLRSRGAGVIEAEIEGYFRAELRLAAHYPPAPATPFPPLENPRAAAIDAADLYRDGWMFHGPAYQGVTRFHARGDNGLDADLRVPTGEGALFDNMGQVAGFWVMEEPESCFGIPIGVERLRFFADDPAIGVACRCQIRVNELDPLNCVTRLRLTDDAGRLLVLADGWRARRYQVDQAFRKRTKLAQVGSLSEPWQDGIVFFEDIHDTAMVRDYIARRYLTVEEIAVYEALPPRRRRQWLNGRCAAKDAVRRYLHARGDTRIFPKELMIVSEDSGRPRVQPHVTMNVPAGLQVSLSHKERYAVAIAAERPVGIDLERIEPRSEAFAAMILSGAERDMLGGEPGDIAYTRAWVAKEAAAKAQGTGLGGNARAWVIEARMGDELCVSGQWVSTRRFADAYVIGWTVAGPGGRAGGPSRDRAGERNPGLNTNETT